VKERFSRMLTQLRQGWGKLPAVAKAGLVVLCAGLLAFSVWLSVRSDEGPYEPLFGQPIELEQAARIRDHLETRGIPYRIGSDDAILVPRDRKRELVMQLATEELLPTTAIGWEIFDEQRFGASDFEQRVNFQRALEGELVRTIRTIKGVERVRVHLSLPKRSIFREEETTPSASVTLGLRPGTALGTKHVAGIQELVARSVERLEPGRVAVFDESGQKLSQDPDQSTGTHALDYQAHYEQDLENRLVDILERTIGEGHAVVRVHAEFDFTQTEEMQESYDPERSVIRSEQIVREAAGEGAEQVGGIPGVRSNLPGGPGPQKAPGGANSRRESETRNYEVDKVVRRVTNPVAVLKRQSVAVLVDGRWEEPASESGERTFTPRDAGELDRLASLVKRAVGFDPERGDTVDIQSMRFVSTEETAPSGVTTTAPTGLPGWITWAGVAAAAVLVLAVVVVLALRRRRVPGLSEEPRTVKELEAAMEGEVGARALVPGAVPVPGALPGRVSVEDGEEIRREAVTLVTQDAAAAARVIRAWLSEEPERQEAASRRI
jgi:flagellar M-ring protein FliF